MLQTKQQRHLACGPFWKMRMDNHIPSQDSGEMASPSIGTMNRICTCIRYLNWVGYFKNGNSRMSPTSHFSDAMWEMWYENSQSPLPFTSQVGCGKFSRPNILDWEVGSLKVRSGTQTRNAIFKISYSGRTHPLSRSFRSLIMKWEHRQITNQLTCRARKPVLFVRGCATES